MTLGKILTLGLEHNTDVEIRVSAAFSYLLENRRGSTAPPTTGIWSINDGARYSSPLN